MQKNKIEQSLGKYIFFEVSSTFFFFSKNAMLCVQFCFNNKTKVIHAFDTTSKWIVIVKQIWKGLFYMNLNDKNKL
jgi:hypothetical protein